MHVASHQNAPNCLTNIAALWPVLYVSRAPTFSFVPTAAGHCSTLRILNYATHQRRLSCIKARQSAHVRVRVCECVCVPCALQCSVVHFLLDVCVCVCVSTAPVSGQTGKPSTGLEKVCVACVVVVGCIKWAARKHALRGNTKVPRER